MNHKDVLIAEEQENNKEITETITDSLKKNEEFDSSFFLIPKKKGS